MVFESSGLAIFLFLLLISGTAAQCAAGNYIAPNGSCTPCPAIFAQPEANQSGCIPCPPNSLLSFGGLSRCRTCVNAMIPNPDFSFCLCDRGENRNDDTGVCELCPPGTSWVFRRRDFLSGDPNDCQQCEVNFFQDQFGQGVCQECLIDEISNEDRTACIKCPPGEAQGPDGCIACPPGMQMSVRDPPCLECSPRSFRTAEDGGISCLPCPGNRFSLRGSVSCVTCPEGSALMADGSCGTCAPGSHYDEITLSCSPCERNEFMDVENVRLSCYRCSSRDVSAEGATECTPCGPDMIRSIGRCISISTRCERGQLFDVIKGCQ